jgi:hypothetical protein
MEYRLGTLNLTLSISQESKMATKKKAAKAKTVRPPTDTQKVLFKLMQRENGASLADLKAAGLKQAAMAIVHQARNHGFKASAKKVAGERTRYFACNNKAGGNNNA